MNIISYMYENIFKRWQYKIMKQSQNKRLNNKQSTENQWKKYNIFLAVQDDKYNKKNNQKSKPITKKNPKK